MTATINASTTAGVVITPDNSGSLALQAGGNTIVQTSTSSTALLNAAGRPMVAQSGCVLQVVSTFNTNTVGITTATSLVPLSITLSSTSSKVLVCASMTAERVNGTQGGSYIYVYIRRNTTMLGNSGSVFNALGYQSNVNSRQGGSIQYLDSPASTSALTYDMYQDFATSGGAQFNFYGLNITLMEIAG